jgi:hypothetical protein
VIDIGEEVQSATVELSYASCMSSKQRRNVRSYCPCIVADDGLSVVIKSAARQCLEPEKVCGDVKICCRVITRVLV